MPDDENEPEAPGDGWEGTTDDYQVDITLPDGSTVTQSTSRTGDGTVESTLKDPDGNFVRSWDSDTDLSDGGHYPADPAYQYPPNEMSGDELQRWFDDHVVDTPEFKDSAKVLSEWSVEHIKWEAHTLDFNPELKHGLEALKGVADPFRALNVNPTVDKDADWSFTFGRLGLDAQREFYDGWTRQYQNLAEPSWFGAKAMEWFRKAPVMGTLILIFGTAVIVVPVVLISLDDDPVQVEAEFSEPVDSATDEPPPPGQTETETETEPEPQTEPEPDAEPEIPPEQAFAPIPSGTTEITGLIDSACGGLYSVYLRAMAFDNQQTTVDQLDSERGNPFQTASGWGNGRISMLTGGDNSFYEVWFFLWNLGELLSIYNVYGTSADFTAPESAEDVARFESVQSPEDLLAAVNGSSDSCAAEVAIETADFSAFPEANR